MGKNVFAGDWIALGLGAGISPSYSGSDDYRAIPLPVIQGRIGPVAIQPRPAGLALDLLAGARRGRQGQLRLSLGPSLRVRSDRASGIEDEVVRRAGKLDRAVELGLAAGLGIEAIATRADSLSLSVDARRDIAGAHSGWSIEPSVSYSRPLGRAAFASLSLGGQLIDDDFADYYFSVSPAQAAASGGLAPFAARGGLASLNATALLGLDLGGNALDGGWGLTTIAGYSRLQGDAARTPYTRDRGSADQLLFALALVYTF